MPGLHTRSRTCIKDRELGLSVRLRRASERSNRSGQALLEFAFVSLGFYFLLAGTVELGRAIFSGQILQNAARVCARELAVMPLPATYTFEEALGDPLVRELIYDPGLLVLDVNGRSGAVYESWLDELPIVNRMLAPLMLRERISLGGGELDVLRYPGAIFSNPTPNTTFDGALPYTVRIPRVTSADTTAQTIEWVDVIEEIRGASGDGPFSILQQAGPALRGIAAVRISYPFQAATLSSFKYESGINEAIEANDANVSATGGGGGGPIAFGSTTVNSYSGLYGLGSQEALGKKVRPFRRLLAAQSIFRREVFK